LINPETLIEYILNLSRSDAINFIEECKVSRIKLYPTRKERYLLYKKLKGKESPFTLYSYGKENRNTRKFLIIKHKKTIK